MLHSFHIFPNIVFIFTAVVSLTCTNSSVSVFQ
jgi:hypothetical protein